jgi:uncharacterized protein (DUF1330 family)
LSSEPVLVIVEVQEIFDAAAFNGYRARARRQLTEQGGTLLGRGGALFEGSPDVGLAVLVQHWPSEVAFREWQASEAYAPLRVMRDKSARLRIMIVPAEA